MKLVSRDDKNSVLQKLPAQFAGTVYIQANRPPWFGMHPIGSLADNPAKPCAQLLDPVAESDIGPGVSLRTPCLAGGRESRYDNEPRRARIHTAIVHEFGLEIPGMKSVAQSPEFSRHQIRAMIRPAPQVAAKSLHADAFLIETRTQ